MTPRLWSRGTPVLVALYWAPLVAWMAAIFILSSLTPSEIREVSEPAGGLRSLIRPELVHIVEFAGVAVLFHRLLDRTTDVSSPRLWAAVLVFTFGYGLVDELHQAFVPGREPSWEDVVFDTVGGLGGVMTAELLSTVRRRITKS